MVDETAAVSENVPKKPKLDFVDAAASSMGTDTRDFNPVSSGMPSDLVRDAIRLDSKQALFPWEKGGLKAIFGERPLVESLVPKVKTSSNNFVQVNVAVGEGPSLRTARAIEVEHKTSDKALYMSAVKSFRGGSYIEERAIRRSSAVKLLKAHPDSCDPGRAMLAEASPGMEDSYGMEVLSACFVLKSPNKLLKRYYSLKSYSDWLCGRGFADWLPLVEQHVWRYLQYLRESAAPPTKRSSFVEAVRFGHFPLDGSEGMLSSLRSGDCPHNCSHASDLGSQQIP